MPETIVVVPCYNEERRLQAERFEAFLKGRADVQLLFVNDGSTDATLARLRELEERVPGRIRVIDQQPNRGKAEAVRLGMREAFQARPRYAGFWDADLATPLEAIPELVAILEAHRELEIVFGSRVKLLGRSIERRLLRHYLGRIFATAASVMLRLPVYDTQCGAKLFRVGEDVEQLFRTPFVTRWIFDVEIIARLIQARRGSDRPGAEQVIHEHPLRCWRDVSGSKIGPLDFPRAFVEMLRIYLRYLR